MTPSALLAEKIRETTETKTDYATARALGVSQSYLKQVLLGNRNFGPEACVRASEILRQPLSNVLAEIELSKATTPEKKAFWEKRLPRILPAVAIWGLAAGVMQFTPQTCSAANYSHDTLYIMRSSRARRWERFSSLLEVAGLTAYGLVRYAHRMVYKLRSAELIFRPLMTHATIPLRSRLQWES